MDQTLVLAITLAIVLGIVCIIQLVLPRLKDKGVDIPAMIDLVAKNAAAVEQTLATVRPFIEDKADLSIVDKAIEFTGVGVHASQQLHKIGQLESDEDRRTAAREFAINALKVAKIDVTPELERVIDGTLQSDVWKLGHKKD